MKVIVTAGGTVEPIDDVRSISNYSTGRMGITIANYLLSQGVKVIFVANQNIQDKLLDHDLLIRKEITNVKSVMITLENILLNEDINAVIHTMAVSDYKVYGVCSEEQIETVFSAQDLNYTQFINQFTPMVNQKLNSSHEELYIRLTQTPKIIQYIKKWQPDTLLIGFKLLVDANIKQFEEATLKQQYLANSDYVVANDLQKITDEYHHTMIFKDGQIIKESNTRTDLAKHIFELILIKEGL